MGDETVLLQLRNPWGDTEWEGDWSDNSPCWTDDIKKQVNFVDDPDDGCFWMCFEDMKNYFSCIELCKINDQYNYSHKETSHKPGKFSLVRFKVHSDGPATISVTQKDKRCFPRGSDYKYSYVKMILAKIDLENTNIHEDGDKVELEYIKGNKSASRDTHVEL